MKLQVYLEWDGAKFVWIAENEVERFCVQAPDPEELVNRCNKTLVGRILLERSESV